MEKRKDIDIVNEIARVAEAEFGWRSYIVGGWVRDLLLNRHCKDIDVEIFGPKSNKELESFLRRFGPTGVAGIRFMVVKLHTGNGMPIDFSLPRRDTKTGVGYKGFTVKADPSMTPEQAASRRDFTFNGLMYDLTANVRVFSCDTLDIELQGQKISHGQRGRN